jgi:hypothetical protein
MIDPIDIERTQCAGVGDVIMVTVGHSLVEWRDSIVREVIAIAVDQTETVGRNSGARQ